MHGLASPAKRPRPAGLDAPPAPTAPRPRKRACTHPPALPSPPTPPVLPAPSNTPRLRLPGPGAPGGLEPAIVLRSFFRAQAPVAPPYLGGWKKKGRRSRRLQKPADGSACACGGKKGGCVDAGEPVLAEHREVVVNWLIEVRGLLGARWTTVALAVALFDRFLGRTPIGVCALQAVGAACMFIVVKHEEAVPARVARIVELCGGSVDGTRLLALERAILNDLQFAVAVPTPLSALGLLSSAVAPSTPDASHVAQFAARIAMLDAKIACVPPAPVALAAIHLAVTIVPSTDGVMAGRRKRLAQLDRACADGLVMKVARRLLRFWNHTVLSHDAGSKCFLVGKQTWMARRIFGSGTAERLEGVYGVRVVTKDGFFVGDE